jgi:methylglyoxal reductase
MSQLIIRPIGSSGLEASVVGLGTWAIGGDGWGGSQRSDDIAAIQAGIDSGINLIDTAPIYGFGISEEIVGEAIVGRRNKVILASKCGLRWNAEVGEFNFEDGAGNRIHKCLSPESISYELEQSLRRLKVDCIDLYQTHWQTSTTAIEDTMAELVHLKDAGKIRAIGISNVTEAEVDSYQACGEVVSIQEMYSMIDRKHEASLFPYSRKQGLAVLAYSPLAMGLLTGKLGPERVFGPDDNRSWSPRFTVENRVKVNSLLNELLPIAKEANLTLPQLVITWTVAQPMVTHVLCGARTVQQAMENAVGGMNQLDDPALAAITGIVEKHAVHLPHPFLPDE